MVTWARSRGAQALQQENIALEEEGARRGAEIAGLLRRLEGEARERHETQEKLEEAQEALALRNEEARRWGEEAERAQEDKAILKEALGMARRK
eukprot:1767900-Rhodomonas_salina.1